VDSSVLAFADGTFVTVSPTARPSRIEAPIPARADQIADSLLLRNRRLYLGGSLSVAAYNCANRRAPRQPWRDTVLLRNNDC
jgi:hypothetical protein